MPALDLVGVICDTWSQRRWHSHKLNFFSGEQKQRHRKTKIFLFFIFLFCSRFFSLVVTASILLIYHCRWRPCYCRRKRNISLSLRNQAWLVKDWQVNYCTMSVIRYVQHFIFIYLFPSVVILFFYYFNLSLKRARYIYYCIIKKPNDKNQKNGNKKQINILSKAFKGLTFVYS